MARLTDHDIRDAEDALRKELSLVLNKYARRMAEMGKAHIQEAIETANKEGLSVDGTSIGRTAAARAAYPYFGDISGGDSLTVVEGNATRTIEA
jgi:hypothetical protein